ncbi:hypothetical protein H0E87_028594 [Populus deltoides]|uniref:Uncharacterized protein n=1 Tax=Populus deltoides TaxID=3696 RepID=A0A8T2WUL6_POPDE|nr:hypothetical protein H0E87_028594 [Populus deltoides]
MLSSKLLLKTLGLRASALQEMESAVVAARTQAFVFLASTRVILESASHTIFLVLMMVSAYHSVEIDQSRRSLSCSVSFSVPDLPEIGLGLTGFGIFFSFLGIVFFFDKGFLAMGNILFISGVSLTIGPKSTMQFFMKRQNFKGTISFGAGFFFVVIGWPVIGMILEAYGFIVLFSGFWPTLAVFIQKIPILGWVFQQPFVRSETVDFDDRFSSFDVLGFTNLHMIAQLSFS